MTARKPGGLLPPVTFRVYVITLSPKASQRLRTRKPAVYVGQTHLDPRVRLEYHLRGGPPSSRWVRHYGVRVVAVAGPVGTRGAAERLERETARQLKKQGYAVVGGH
jgi:hypothetical protein